MLWVTRDYVHLDRVACPWLIKRFVDPQAEFVFVPWGREDERPAQAIPFAIPGVELGPHDDHGTTFQKILAKYGLQDPALVRLGKVIAHGVDHSQHGYRPEADQLEGQIAVGLLAVSEGMMLCTTSDQQTLEASYPVYDALYANFTVHAIMQQRGIEPPPRSQPGPGEKFGFLRKLFKDRQASAG